MFWRRGTTRAQARRDREWRQFVRDLTDTAGRLSPGEDDRMQVFLESQSAGERRDEPPAERAA